MNRATLRQILDLARWAPSGDNTQTWRFEIDGDAHVVIHGFDTRDHCVYDIDGHPSQISIGALLETIRIAASGHGLSVTSERRPSDEARPVFDIWLKSDPGIVPSPLIPYITTRTVQRRALSTRALSAEQKSALEASVGSDYSIRWVEGWRGRWDAARLMFASAKIRLTMPEAYAVHKSIIEWNARFSTDRIPDQAVGLDPLTTRVMHWVMQDWRRVEFFNRYLGGTLAPRLQLDVLPALACAAHFVIAARRTPTGIDDYVAAGSAVQRFWLTAAQLGLLLQPEMTPLIFSLYARDDRKFSVREDLLDCARQVRADLARLIGDASLETAVYMGRVGSGATPTSRSTRIDLETLLKH
ncbi:MAG: UBA/THIF-type binding fold protein [Proteobacteria bacterium]|nr:UBA/THIF-type binding fold protein [Pseudomonadota bacterium]